MRSPTRVSVWANHPLQISLVCILQRSWTPVLRVGLSRWFPSTTRVLLVKPSGEGQVPLLCAVVCPWGRKIRITPWPATVAAAGFVGMAADRIVRRMVEVSKRLKR